MTDQGTPAVLGLSEGLGACPISRAMHGVRTHGNEDRSTEDRH